MSYARNKLTAAYLAANYTAGTLLGTPYCWLRADTVSSTGGLVDQWTDKSGNARHFTQTLTKRPTLVASGSDPNGFACVTADGVSQCMTNAGFGAMSAISLYLVTRSIVTPGGQVFILSIGNTSTAQSVGVLITNAGVIRANYNNPGSTTSTWNTEAPGSSLQITSFSGTTANGGATVWNGRARLGSVGAAATNASTGSTIANLATGLFANNTGAGSFAQLGLYELVVFNAAHTVEQQANMELLLARYYARL